jgi:hypothetical protein
MMGWEYTVKKVSDFRVPKLSLHCKENPMFEFLFWELRSLSPNFHIHASVHIFPAAEYTKL